MEEVDDVLLEFDEVLDVLESEELLEVQPPLRPQELSEDEPPEDDGGGLVGPGLVGPGFVGPGFVGPGFVGPGFVGPGFVGPGFVGPGLPQRGAPGHAAQITPAEELTDTEDADDAKQIGPQVTILLLV